MSVAKRACGRTEISACVLHGWLPCAHVTLRRRRRRDKHLVAKTLVSFLRCGCSVETSRVNRACLEAQVRRVSSCSLSQRVPSKKECLLRLGWVVGSPHSFVAGFHFRLLWVCFLFLLCVGLKYLDSDSVTPQVYRQLVGKLHSEFATSHQQDAEEFLSMLLQWLESRDTEALKRVEEARRRLSIARNCSSEKTGESEERALYSSIIAAIGCGESDLTRAQDAASRSEIRKLFTFAVRGRDRLECTYAYVRRLRRLSPSAQVHMSSLRSE